jgi:hypothetical protein
MKPAAAIDSHNGGLMLRARRRTTLTLLLLAVTLIASNIAAAAQNVDVTVAVDFGPMARPPLDKAVTLAEKSTVFDALRVAFPIETSGR